MARRWARSPVAGWHTRHARGVHCVVSSVLALAGSECVSLMPFWPLAFICLTLFGYLSGMSSLIQYQLIQTRTPDHMLGRINGLWTAQT